MRALPEPLPRLSSQPLLLGRYKLLGRLGAGGMSEVFLAVEHVLGEPTRHVAIKSPRDRARHGLGEGVASLLFAREGKNLLAVGHHPNVCHGYELCRVGARDALVMEWIDGLSVRALSAALALRTERFSCGEAAALAAQAAAGLEHAHMACRADGVALGLVHRDVNPTNLMLRYDGVLKVIDFGVARGACDAPNATDGLVVGKFEYMAPEQLRGHALDARTDVFALGVCLFEWLTGRRLYRHDGLPEICEAVWHGPVPSPRALEPALPEALDAIVQRALQKDPAQRFQSAGALSAALDSFLVEARLPGGARPIATLLDRVIEPAARTPRLQYSPLLELLLAEARGTRPSQPPGRGTRPTSPPWTGRTGARAALLAGAVAVAAVAWPSASSAPPAATQRDLPARVAPEIVAVAPSDLPAQERGALDAPALLDAFEASSDGDAPPFAAHEPAPAPSVRRHRASHGFVVRPGF